MKEQKKYEAGSHTIIKWRGKEYCVKVIKDNGNTVTVKGPAGNYTDLQKTELE